MYSEEDINSAVAAGALSTEAAASLRAHVAQLRDMPRVDEENFRLVSSFNDIFVAIGVVIMLVAVAAVGQAIARALAPIPLFPFEGGDEAQWDAIVAAQQLNFSLTALFGGALGAATAWGLSEFFTRKRRMALPSIILLLAYVGSVFAGFLGLGAAVAGDAGRETLGGFIVSVAGLVAAGAAWLHWRRFRVPITIAAGAGALAVTVIGLVVSALDAAGVAQPFDAMLWFVFFAGIAIFAFAMRWDISDPARITRRSDVAFWLHLLAAPLLAHPIFYGLGLIDGSAGVAGSLAVLAIYVVFGLVALAIDRRALLVSALAYVLVALAFLFDRFGAVELAFALTALVIGSALLTLSAFWTPIRARVVGLVPDTLRTRLPDAAGRPASASA